MSTGLPSAVDASPAIEMSNVGFWYSSRTKQTEVLRDFNLSVAESEFVCVLGPSGSGKSTILNLIAGFVRPNAGSVRSNARDVSFPGPDRGVVFQEFVLFPWRTVRGNIASGLEFAGMGNGEISERVDILLESVGLRDFDAYYPAALSGGMQQRVALARTLANRPKILLMDEPFGALDAQTRQQMQTLLLKLWHIERQTILFVTHDIDEALYLSDRIVVITERPARVSKIFRPGLDRPRDRNVFQDDRYIRAKREISDIIFSQLRDN